MFSNILAKGFSVIRRMNQWWDKDEDKEVAAVIAGFLILVGILVLKKPILFIVALVLVVNRVIHRFNLWTHWECSFAECESSVSSSVSVAEIPDEEAEEYDITEVKESEEDESK